MAAWQSAEGFQKLRRPSWLAGEMRERVPPAGHVLIVVDLGHGRVGAGGLF